MTVRRGIADNLYHLLGLYGFVYRVHHLCRLATHLHIGKDIEIVESIELILQIVYYRV